MYYDEDEMLMLSGIQQSPPTRGYGLKHIPYFSAQGKKSVDGSMALISHG